MTDTARCRHVRQHVVTLANGLRSQRCTDCGWEIARLPGLPDPVLTDAELQDVATAREAMLKNGWPLGPLPAFRRGR